MENYFTIDKNKKIRYSLDVNRIIEISVKDPTTFYDSKNYAYTNYKIESIFELKNKITKCIIVYHRFNEFEELKGKLNMVMKNKQTLQEINNEFPQKPYLLVYGQFNAQYVIERASKFNKVMKILMNFLKENPNEEEIKDLLFPFLMQGDVDLEETKYTNASNKDLFKLPYKACFNNQLELKTAPFEEAVSGSSLLPNWYNLATFGVFYVESISNYFGFIKFPFRIIYKDKDLNKSFVLALAEKREDIDASFYSIKRLCYQTLQLNDRQVIQLLPLIFHYINKNIENICNFGDPLM